MGSRRRERPRVRARRGASGVCALPFSGREPSSLYHLDFWGRVNLLSLESRARGKQPPGRRLFYLRKFFLRPAPAGGGGVAAELWGRVGASGLACARVGG